MASQQRSDGGDATQSDRDADEDRQGRMQAEAGLKDSLLTAGEDGASAAGDRDEDRGYLAEYEEVDTADMLVDDELVGRWSDDDSDGGMLAADEQVGAWNELDDEDLEDQRRLDEERRSESYGFDDPVGRK